MNQPVDPSLLPAAEIGRLENSRRNVRLESSKGFAYGAASALPMTTISSVLIGGVAAAFAAVGGVALLPAFVIAGGATMAVGSTMAGAGSANERRREAQLHNYTIDHAVNAIRAGADPTQSLYTASERQHVDHPIAARVLDTGRRAMPGNWVSHLAHRDASNTPHRG